MKSQSIKRITGLAPLKDQPESVRNGHEIHRQSRVINRAYVKSWAIDYAASNRCHQFTRVSEEFLNAVESNTKAFIRNRIQCAPSKGVTLK